MCSCCKLIIRKGVGVTWFTVSNSMPPSTDCKTLQDVGYCGVNNLSESPF
uniref:Uncharacterized protein n=1 Tax=Physcomitrium patens TaxID=3218 RepID=A0A2K1JHH7_PHYPA|nr:hypothetical protein PHYPA_018413 [Physcomitrium patens]